MDTSPKFIKFENRLIRFAGESIFFSRKLQKETGCLKK